MAAKQLVEKFISEHAIAMFSKSYCPYCKRSKDVISKLNVDQSKVGVLELDQTNDGSDIQNYLKEKTDKSTVPSIFISGDFIGGCDDLLKIQSDGELDKLVANI
ncbi:hypothetical protein MVES1_003995 [Malassezia vespertilionis]|uniref:uncharacterized protein n=1 Tax=Malassezia vespertilionis TaxID=2020962 RepID=UPI0024B1D3F0|nr:uncharacterized protein MVES1_003995 [Malassezia vespertilionis]WFD08619.1 hypothetical protein MVES1_003995 [Malassezia vespertilionis]